MSVIIVDYNMGNVGSIANMIKYVGGEAIITSDPAVIEQADKLILPGVGAFDTGMQALRDMNLLDILHKQVLQERVPVLGVCLGMQLLGHSSEEGKTTGLGWINAKTIRFEFDDPSILIPHMGWNDVTVKKQVGPFAHTQTGDRFYFVHSYHMVCDDSIDIAMTTTYGKKEVTAAIACNNIFATQFHPEKSHRFGMNIYKAFLTC